LPLKIEEPRILLNIRFYLQNTKRCAHSASALSRRNDTIGNTLERIAAFVAARIGLRNQPGGCTATTIVVNPRFSSAGFVGCSYGALTRERVKLRAVVLDELDAY
jgi:hypothetical protein